ncbi:MAG: histidine phosphatase family protein [Candidatus Woesearchaeota archaeon]
MKIIFVRHGLTKEGKEKKNLIKEGREQARLLAKRLKKEKIDKLYSSDMPRAKQTAEIISKEINLPIELKPELREYEEAIFLVEDLSKWPEEEQKKLKKLKIFLNELIKSKEEDKTILVVAHGITNRLIISNIMKIPMGRTFYFRQFNTCINIIHWTKDSPIKDWKLSLMNDVSHLTHKLGELSKSND